MRNQETELQEQLPSLHQENTRINALMNQIEIANSSINIRHQEFTQQLQTPNIEINHLQTEVFNLRNSVGGINVPKVETQTIFEIRGKKTLPWLVKVFGILQRLSD